MQLNMPLLQKLYGAFATLNWAEKAQFAKPILWWNLDKHLQPPDPSEWRQAAIAEFQQVADQLPDEPWIWFQIGWHSFAFEDRPRDLETARKALQRVLELEPDNAPAHLGMAWLLFQESYGERNLTQEEVSSIWNGPIGEHLRSGLNADGLAQVWGGRVKGLALLEEGENSFETLRWPESLSGSIHPPEAWFKFEYIDLVLRRNIGGTQFTDEESDALTFGDQHGWSLVMLDFRRNLWFNVDGKNWHPKHHGVRSGYDQPYIVTILPYLPTWGGHSAMVQALEAFEDLVPEDHRFAYCMAYATIAMADEVRERWYEEALRFPTDDQVALLRMHRRLAETAKEKGDVLRGFKEALAIHECIMKIEGDDRYLEGSTSDLIVLAKDWPESVPEWRDDLPESAVELYQRMADAALDCAQRWWWDPYWVIILISIGEILVTAARLALDRNDVIRAKAMAETAREVEGFLDADEVEELNPEGFSALCEANARMLREIRLIDSDFQAAANENDRILVFSPGDKEARDLKLKLVSILEQRQAAVGLAELMMATRNQPQLPAQTVSVGDEVLTALSEIRAQLSVLTEQQLDTDDANSLRDQHHDLVQQHTLIQPNAMRWAKTVVIDDLGEDVFNRLHPDAQHFLVTAQVYFDASKQVAGELDASPIVIEFAKGLEAELRFNLLSPLENQLESVSFRGKLPIGSRNGDPIGPKGEGKWSGVLSALSLGQATSVLKNVIDNTDNLKVRQILLSASESPQWLSSLISDLMKVVNDYRNRAAHIERVERQQLDEFRDLLIGNGLLRRLTQLEKQLRELPSVPRQDRSRSRSR